jgi:hypothetical protein
MDAAGGEVAGADALRAVSASMRGSLGLQVSGAVLLRRDARGPLRSTYGLAPQRRRLLGHAHRAPHRPQGRTPKHPDAIKMTPVARGCHRSRAVSALSFPTAH